MISLEDLDEVSVAQYRQLLGSVRPGHPFLKWDDKGLLLKLGGWKRIGIQEKKA